MVFLGPSLPTSEARRMLPARYLGPVQCGDIVRVLRTKPRAIAIVDGLFETTPAVWHKEILLALADDVAVFGASSMGALRAAELAPFGMVGVGKIFEAYRDGIYTDDDEVAMLHGPATMGYPATSEAMVNIRATVAAALGAGTIAAEAAERVIRCAKDTFYQERSLDDAIDRALSGNGNGGDAERFRRFIADGGYVDQKRLDALALVRRLAELRASGLPRPDGLRGVHRSYFIRRLQYEVLCDSVDSADRALPTEERVANEARALGSVYSRLQQLAQLLSFAHALAESHGLSASPRDVRRVYKDTDFGWGSKANTRRWSQAMDIDDAERAALIQRLAVVGRLITEFAQRWGRSESKRRYDASLLALLRIDGRYASFRPRARRTRAGIDRAVVRSLAKRSAVEFGLYRRLAKLWSILDDGVGRLRITPFDSLQVRSDDFRRSRGLDRRAATQVWQRLNNIDQDEYIRLVGVDSRLSMLCNGSYAYWLGLLPDRGPAFGLVDAIRLAGLYPALRRRVRHHAAARRSGRNARR